MDKLKRYEHFDSRIGEETVCMDDDVSIIECENERLKAENKKLRLGIASVSYLIYHSFGVAGLHLNGDLAPWESLTDGGHSEEWLTDFSTAEKLI